MSVITLKQIAKLKKGLEACILKLNKDNRTSSIALTASGREYLGALIGSDTHLMHIAPEQAALALSTASSDFPVRQIITMIESEKDFTLSPIVVKVLIDYASRSQEMLGYVVVNTQGKIIVETDDVNLFFPLYNPAPIIIKKIKEKYSVNKAKPKITGKSMPKKLKEYAILGLDKNFPLYDSASSYGTAVYTSDGYVYYAGQYSSPDKRLNLHSEMVAILSAILDGKKDISAIGIVSSKYPDGPCNMCGSCRQFITEISAKLNISPDLYCFSKNTGEFKKFKIEEYLPDSWSSKNWTK